MALTVSSASISTPHWQKVHAGSMWDGHRQAQASRPTPSADEASSFVMLHGCPLLKLSTWTQEYDPRGLRPLRIDTHGDATDM
jgi:hypothetical protein